MAESILSQMRIPAGGVVGDKDAIQELLNMQAAAEQERRALAQEQLMKDLEASSKIGPVYDLSALAALVPGNTPLVQSMSQQAGRFAEEGAARDKRIQELQNLTYPTISKSGGGAAASILTSQNREEARGERQFFEKQLRFEETFQKDFETTVFKTLNERKNQFGLMEGAIESGDLITMQQVLAQFARGISGEKGVLTNQDIARVMPRTVANDIVGLERYLGIHDKDSVDPKVLSKMRDLLEIARSRASSVYSDYLDTKEKLYRNRSGAKAFGLFTPGGLGESAFSEARMSLAEFARPSKLPGQGNETKPTQDSQSGGFALDMNAVKAELERRKKSK